MRKEYYIESLEAARDLAKELVKLNQEKANIIQNLNDALIVAKLRIAELEVGL